MKKKILIIDDQQRFDLFAFDVTYAKSSNEAYELLKANKYDEMHLFFNIKGSPIYEILLECKFHFVELPPVIRILSNTPNEISILKEIFTTEFDYKVTGLTGKMLVKK